VDVICLFVSYLIYALLVLIDVYYSVVVLILTKTNSNQNVALELRLITSEITNNL
jgi:hypothetical protein